MSTFAARGRHPGPLHGKTVHQALHGYDHGHRLLASSRGVDDDDLRLIDRLSDASGQHPVPDNEDYLTGYPLPSGRAYAFARTWYVPEPPRPNVVWTHTLLVPHAALGPPNLNGLLALLRKPSWAEAPDWAPYRSPLAPPAAGSDPEAGLDPTAAWAVLAELYRPGAVTAVCVLEGRERRDRLCMAVWDQQWPRLRRHFSFCSGALEPRRASAGPFDLLLMPAHHGYPAPTPSPRDPLRPHLMAALAADLGEPGALRAFLRACGPDSARRRVMPLLVEAYVMASSGEHAAAVRQVTAQAPKAASMRRLKRALLNPESDLLRHAPPVDLLATLLGPDVAEHILVADANLAHWASRTWELEPAAVLASIPAPEALDGPPVEAATRNSAPGGEGAGGPTVAQAARQELASVVGKRAEPRHLAALAERAPALAAGLVTGRNEESWWSAWALLPAAVFQNTLATGRFDEPPGLLRAVAALTREAPGLAGWRALRDRIGAAAVAALLAQPRHDGPWTQALGERLELLAQALRSGLSAAQVAAACNAVPDLAFVRALGFGPFASLAATPRLWQQEPRHAAVVLAAALDAGSGQADTAAAETYGWLYERFAADVAWDAWELLEPALPGKKSDWDRCKRLARGVGDAVRGNRGSARPGVLAAVPAGPARDALQAQLERRAARQAEGDSSQPQQDAWDGMVRLFWPW